MKYLTVLAVLLSLFLSQVAFAGDNSRLDKVNWEAFSANLVEGLTMNNDGVRQAALQHIITYEKRLDVNDAVFDIVRIYRFHKNERFRQLAVVALTKVENDYAAYYLKRSLKFEKNPTIHRQILDYVYRYQQEQLACQDSRVDMLIAAMLK
jgi:hypothetical protein